MKDIKMGINSSVRRAIALIKKEVVTVLHANLFLYK